MGRELNKKELAALAMHELMKREQEVYQKRASEQQRISLLSDDRLKALVDGIPLKDIEEAIK